MFTIQSNHPSVEHIMFIQGSIVELQSLLTGDRVIDQRLPFNSIPCFFRNWLCESYPGTKQQIPPGELGERQAPDANQYAHLCPNTNV